MSPSIAIVYHSGYGHTAKVAEAIAAGAGNAGGSVAVIAVQPDGTIADAHWDTLDRASAIIFGAPTYMGSVSGPFKMFMDATSRKWGDQAWQNKIAAGFTNSASYSGDKSGSLQQLVTLAMQHGMIWVGQSERAPQFNETDLPDLDKINRLGSWTGLMTQSNHAAGADIVPGAGDLETAKRFGARIANTTRHFSTAQVTS